MREFIIQIFKIIINYRYYSIIIIVYELYFSFFYQNKYNKLSVSRYKSATNPIPTPFYLIKLIDAFIIKKKIKHICDLGSGYGKNLYYFGEKKKYKIEGIEIDKKIFSKIFISKKIKIYNTNIHGFNFSKKKYDLLIVNDPFTDKKDYKKLINKLLKERYKKHLVFINIDLNKRKIIKNFSNFFFEKKFSGSRCIIFAKLKI